MCVFVRVCAFQSEKIEQVKYTAICLEQTIDNSLQTQNNQMAKQKLHLVFRTNRCYYCMKWGVNLMFSLKMMWPIYWLNANKYVVVERHMALWNRHTSEMNFDIHGKSGRKYVWPCRCRQHWTLHWLAAFKYKALANGIALSIKPAHDRNEYLIPVPSMICPHVLTISSILERVDNLENQGVVLSHLACFHHIYNHYVWYSIAWFFLGCC